MKPPALFLGMMLSFAIQIGWAEALDRADQPPKEAPAGYQQIWEYVNCKSKPIRSESKIGSGWWDSSSEEMCFYFIRKEMIHGDQSSKPTEDFHILLRREQIVIFDDHNGYKRICHAIPLREPYDLDYDKILEDFLANNFVPTKEILKQLDQNIKIDCGEM